MKNEKDSERYREALSCLCPKIAEALARIPDSVKDKAQEIRLRTGCPLTICAQNETWFLKRNGSLSRLPAGESLFIAEREDLEESFRGICGYSVYSHQNEIKNGYITLRGGHRAGICGTAVCTEGEVSGIRDISSINLRIARQIDGAAASVFKALGGAPLGGVLLAGPPASGKTTILRDLAKNLSYGALGAFYKVAVIDERGELSGSYAGISRNNLGLCDILNGYPKEEGILQAVRCLSPDYIVCDEAGSMKEICSIEEGVNAGVRLIASIHAGSEEELVRRKQVRRLLQTGAFQHIVLLGDRSSPGRIQRVYKEGELDVKMDRLSAAHSGVNRRGNFSIA